VWRKIYLVRLEQNYCCSYKKIQQDTTIYQHFIIPYLYEAQHVSGDTPPIIRNLKLHCEPLVFHTWEVVGRVFGGRCQAHCAWQRPATFHVWKTRGSQCSFRLLIMGGVSPETCWASYKYEIIKFWYIVAFCWIFLYELYYDGRIHEYQVQKFLLVYCSFLTWMCPLSLFYFIFF